MVTNDNNKQRTAPLAVAVEKQEAFSLLTKAGFDEAIAIELSQGRGLTEIRQQIKWLPMRNPQHNELGMLRRVIEE